TVATPTLIAPTGSVNTVTPSYTWNGVTGVAQYELYVLDLATGLWTDQNVTGTSSTPSQQLLAGHGYEWWIRGLDGAGGGGSWTTGLDFTVALPQLLGPSGAVNSKTPLFTWNTVTGLPQYEVYLLDLTSGSWIDQNVTGGNFTPSPLVWGH